VSSFQRPTLAQIAAQITAGFQALLAGAVTALRRSNLAVTATVTAAALDGEYGYLDWIIDNALMPDTATPPYSTRWGAVKGVTPKGPVAATGSATVSGAITGTDVPLGTQLQLQPGLVFATSADATADGGGNVTAPIVAVLPTPASDGSQWNCGAGAALTMVQGIAGIPNTWASVAAITDGAPPESNAAFVARYLQLFRQPPQGGDQNDYIEWALELPAVTRAWCAPLQKGAGTVVVYFMEDVAESAYGGFPQGTNGVATAETRDTPAAGDQLALADFLYPLRPATALVYAFAPTAVPQNFTLKYVPSGEQSAVEAAIAALLFQEGAAASLNSAGAVVGGTVELSDIQAAVRAAPNCAGALVTAPTDNIATSIGELPTLGTCTFL
jgi:uncharacterized phage protein gp47/JayE